MSLFNFFKSELPRPKTNIQEVMFLLIKKRKISFIDFYYLQGFRARVSEIRQMGIFLQSEQKTKYNKFGNIYCYVELSVDDENTEKLKSIYLELNKKSKTC